MSVMPAALRPIKGRQLMTGAFNPIPLEPIMTTRKASTTTASRIGAAFAATAMTTLMLGSQLSLAGHYASEADAVLAAQPATPVAQNVAASPTRQPRRT